MLNGDIQAAASSVGDLNATLHSVGVSATQMQQIEAMTRSLFPGPVRIESVVDPEFPDDRRTVVEVHAHGEFREIIERELLWHDKLWEIVGKDVGLNFGLCVFPQ
jgi:hypothetical protein